MMPSFSSLENSALAAASLAGSRRRNRPVASGPGVCMWCTVLCLTGGRPPAALATDWNSLKMPLKAGGVASMVAKRPLLAGDASGSAGGLAANRCSETASTIWFAAKSTIRLKCFKKSAPKMAKLTLAKRKVHTKRRPENSTASFFSPQQGMASQLGLLRAGPEPGSAER
jgi:hypothetical protein